MIDVSGVIRISSTLVVLFGFLLEPLAKAADFDDGRADFSISIRGLEIDYRRFFITALPGETVTIRADRAISGDAEAGVFAGNQRGRELRWTAPMETGAYEIRIMANSNDTISLAGFVMRPYGEMQDGILNGYRIDPYPAKPLKGLTIYLPPRGFIEVSDANRNIAISPHFTHGQFISKQTGGYPKYLVLRPQLLLKLEGLLEAVNAQGTRADGFHIMSGYRTPYYNRLIRNVDYSRHLWGGAVDIFVDVSPIDGVMDDLNKDGKTDRADAAYLFDIAERYSRGAGRDFIGGLGEYDANTAHGPFVHIDARGYRARWGRQ